MAGQEPRGPDTDIGIAFACAAKPCGDETVFGFGDGRSVAFGERSFFVDEFGFEEAGLVGVWGGRLRHGGERREGKHQNGQGFWKGLSRITVRHSEANLGEVVRLEKLFNRGGEGNPVLVCLETEAEEMRGNA